MSSMAYDLFVPVVQRSRTRSRPADPMRSASPGEANEPLHRGRKACDKRGTDSQCATRIPQLASMIVARSSPCGCDDGFARGHGFQNDRAAAFIHARQYERAGLCEELAADSCLRQASRGSARAAQRRALAAMPLPCGAHGAIANDVQRGVFYILLSASMARGRVVSNRRVCP